MILQRLVEPDDVPTTPPRPLAANDTSYTSDDGKTDDNWTMIFGAVVGLLAALVVLGVIIYFAVKLVPAGVPLAIVIGAACGLGIRALVRSRRQKARREGGPL